MHHVVVHHLGIHPRLPIGTALRGYAVSHTRQFHIRLQAEVVVVAGGYHEVERTLPTLHAVLREHLHNHHLGACVAARRAEGDMLARGRLYIELVRRQVVLALAVLCARVVGAEESKGFVHRHRSEFVVHPCYLVLTGHVVFVLPRDRQARRVVVRTFHGVDIPVGLQVREVASADVGAHFLHLLVVPKGEGVVVSVAEDNRLFLAGLQVVSAEVAAYIAVGTVVVVPVLRTHLCGYKQADDTDEYGDNRTRALILNSGIHPIGQRQHA